jgi:hypothetical protein
MMFFKNDVLGTHSLVDLLLSQQSINIKDNRMIVSFEMTPDKG